METNPFESPPPAADEVHVVRRGRTLLLTVTAVALWLLAIVWAALGALITYEELERLRRVLSHAVEPILLAMFLSPSMSLAFLGLACWKKSGRWLFYAIVALTPFALLFVVRAFFW